jgi:phosphatidylglycerol:prolipoprotein diacylglycerol transferase
MYPRLSDLFGDLFGIDVQLPLYTFGLMVAIAFLVAAWLLRKELDRKYARGIIGPVLIKDEDGGKRGKVRMKEASPGELSGTVAFIALVGGFIGARVFHILENLPAFFRDPVGMLISSAGLTFFGGLIVAGLAIAYYLRKKGVAIPAFADAVAPGLMLAYGIGRIGCYLAGDGDWGICSNLANKPSWVPGFLWSETFPRNVMGPGQTPVDVIDYTAQQMRESGMDPSVCIGATGVFPTMLYETAMATVLFAVLWALRAHRWAAGWLFGVYLVFAGAERFVIEQIRVNNVGELFGIPVTQAEVISVLLIAAGAAVMARTMRRRLPVEAA